MENKQYLNKKVVVAVDTVKGFKQYLGICKEIIYLGKDTLGVDIFNYTIQEDKTNYIYCFSTNQIKFIGLWTKRG